MRIESDIVSRPSFRRYTFHFANRPNGQNKNRRKRRIGITIVFCVSGTKRTATDDANDLRMRVYCVYPPITANSNNNNVRKVDAEIIEFMTKTKRAPMSRSRKTRTNWHKVLTTQFKRFEIIYT